MDEKYEGGIRKRRTTNIPPGRLHNRKCMMRVRARRDKLKGRIAVGDDGSVEADYGCLAV